MGKKHLKYEESHRVKDNVNEKRCTHCGLWKSEEAFAADSSSKDGFYHWCRICTREHRRKIKTICIDHYGHKCAMCGETDLDVLTLDHINNDGAKRTAKPTLHNKYARLGGSKFYRILLKDNFPAEFKLQTLCCNCQSKKKASYELDKIKRYELCGKPVDNL